MNESQQRGSPSKSKHEATGLGLAGCLVDTRVSEAGFVVDDERCSVFTQRFSRSSTWRWLYRRFDVFGFRSLVWLGQSWFGVQGRARTMVVCSRCIYFGCQLTRGVHYRQSFFVGATSGFTKQGEISARSISGDEQYPKHLIACQLRSLYGLLERVDTANTFDCNEKHCAIGRCKQHISGQR